jgi:hypothetical protein
MFFLFIFIILFFIIYSFFFINNKYENISIDIDALLISPNTNNFISSILLDSVLICFYFDNYNRIIYYFYDEKSNKIIKVTLKSNCDLIFDKKNNLDISILFNNKFIFSQLTPLNSDFIKNESEDVFVGFEFVNKNSNFKTSIIAFHRNKYVKNLDVNITFNYYDGK